MQVRVYKIIKSLISEIRLVYGFIKIIITAAILLQN